MLRFFALGLFVVSVGVVATPDPAKIQLTSRKITSSRSSARKRVPLPADVPLNNFFQGTDLQCVININLS